jgi:hypothetical protein
MLLLLDAYWQTAQPQIINLICVNVRDTILKDLAEAVSQRFNNKIASANQATLARLFAEDPRTEARRTEFRTQLARLTQCSADLFALQAQQATA